MRSMISAAVLAVLAPAGAVAAYAQLPAQPVRAAYVIEPFTPASTITIQGTGVRLRSEPFTQGTQILSHGSTGLPLTVIGIARLPDWNWYQVILKSGQTAFIRSDYTSAPSKGGPAPTPAAPATQLAAPLPPPARIDYGPSSAAPAPVSAPVPLTPQPPTPAYSPPPSYTPPASSYTPTPASVPPAPVPPSTSPAGGSAISLWPTSPVPSGASSPNTGGLSSVDPRQ